jgi:hypothetical protein
MNISPRIGLCAACQHVKVITSAKGSYFIMCELAKTDPRFSKYPLLPVLACSGYRPALSDKNVQKDKV